MKNEMITRTSKIHAIKCANTTDFNQAIESFKTLQWLNVDIIGAKDDKELNEINIKIQDWMNSNPMVSEAQIQSLLNS